MPSNLLTTDTGFPQFREGQTTDQKFEMVLSYLFMLKEQLQYTLANLGTGNFNDTELEELGDSINEPIISRLEDDEGNISILAQTASQIYSRVTDAEGNISNLTQTAMGLSSRVSDAEGNISVLTQTANGLISRVTDVEGNASTLTQTANSLTSRVTSAEGNISTLTQTANSLTSRVTSAEGNISTLTQTATSLTSRVTSAEGNISTLTQTVNGFEFVTYDDLGKSGKTTICGDNITTGTLKANNISLNGFFEVYGTTGSSTRFGGYMGYCSGAIAGISTDGIAIMGPSQKNYVIATSAGARMQSTGASIYVEGSDAVLNGTSYVHGNLTTDGTLTVNSDNQLAFGTNLYAIKNSTYAPSLGTSSYLWDTVYASSGTINTSDRTKKRDTLYDMGAYENLFAELKPTQYKLVDGTSDRYHIGFIAQDIEDALKKAGLSSLDFAGFIKSPVYEKTLDNGEPDTNSEITGYNYALRYSEFVALNTHMIQQLMARVAAMEGKE